MSNSEKTQSTGVRFTLISEDEAGQRIDNYLMRQFKGVPKSHIYRILRKGEVRVNKKRIKPVYKLAAGDNVRLPPMRFSEKKTRRPPDAVIERVESRIVYDDDRLMVVNKPAGLAVHAGTGVDFGVIDALQHLHPGKQVFLVHRLDRDTSGCLLIAKDRPAMLSLQKSIREGEIEKHYSALLMGSWGQGEQRVDLPLLRNKAQGGERLVQVDDEGKKAVSIFYPVREYSGGGRISTTTLMKIKLITGRTHQIRVHALETGHPLAGDRRYGDPEFNIEIKQAGLKRMFLHAKSLAFPHPDGGQKMHIDPPLDDDLQLVLDKLSDY